MDQTISLTAKDGHKLDAYVATPAGKPKGGLVMIQEIFGANRHIRNVADRFAAMGYGAVAPALFDRVEKGVDLGYDPESIAKGRAIREKVPMDGSLADLQAAIDYAKRFGKVGVVGYCWGGSLAFLAATRLSGATAAVGYYGGMIASHATEKPKIPVILHFGDKDQSIPITDVEKVKQARPEIPIYVYSAGHGFSCDERGAFDKTAHELALQRTTAFLKQHIG
jgi:carboxymethylenebutenolidase